jgi:hypothetical protein
MVPRNCGDDQHGCAGGIKPLTMGRVNSATDVIAGGAFTVGDGQKTRVGCGVARLLNNTLDSSRWLDQAILDLF